MNIRHLPGSPGFQRLSSGLRVDLERSKDPKGAGGEARRHGLAVALRSTEDALGLIRSADGSLQAAAVQLGRLEPAPADTVESPATPRARLQALLAELARVQQWLRAAIDDLTTVGENDAAARSDARAALGAVEASERGALDVEGGAR